jgi:hypothetical protein
MILTSYDRSPYHIGNFLPTNTNESTLIQLYHSAIQAFPDTNFRQHATQPIKISKIDWLPFIGTKTLFTKALANNEGKEYNTIILFKGVKYPSVKNEQAIKLTGTDGLSYLIEQIALDKTEVFVRCNCPDFRWRFNLYNSNDHSLFGRKAKKYESKGGPPANPSKLPGMCKHLMQMINALQESSLISPY